MASTTVEISEEGLAEAIASLVTLSTPVDFTKLATDLALVVQADVDERFASSPPVRSDGVVYGGETWPALSDRYLAANPRREGGQQLRDKGELLNSFQVGNSFNISEATPDTITVGSALPKARGLQEKRPMLFIHDELADTVLNVIAEHVARNA